MYVIRFKSGEFFNQFTKQLWDDEVPFKISRPLGVLLSRSDFTQLPEASTQMYQSALQGGMLEGEATPPLQGNSRRRLKSREETRAVLRHQIAEANERMRSKGIIS
jgi:hypothetical protein